MADAVQGDAVQNAVRTLEDLAGKARGRGPGADGLHGARAQQLKALAAAIDPDRRTDVAGWAGVDLFAAFLQEETVRSAGPAVRWAGRMLDIVVQVMFFLPILITWIGLTEATRAYRAVSATKGHASQSFLQGWQNGFDGHLSSAFYLDAIAKDVVIIIAALLILMITQFFFRSFVDEERPLARYRDLAMALAVADKELAPFRIAAPGQSAAAEFQKVATELARTATSIGEAGAAAERTQAAAASGLTAAGDAIGKITALSTAVSDAAARVGQASQGLDQGVHKIAASAQTLADAEAELVRQVQDQAGMLGESAAGLADRLGESAAGLADRMGDAVRESQRQLAAAASESSGEIVRALADGAGTLRGALDGFSLTEQDHAHRMEKAADMLGQADEMLGQIPDAVVGLGARVGDLGDRVSELEIAVTRAKATLPRVDDIPADLQAVLRDLKSAAQALQSSSDLLRSAALGRPAGAARWRPWRRRPKDTAPWAAPPEPAGRPGQPPSGPRRAEGRPQDADGQPQGVR